VCLSSASRLRLAIGLILWLYDAGKLEPSNGGSRTDTESACYFDATLSELT
jgi:hypothetical protein